MWPEIIVACFCAWWVLVGMWLDSFLIERGWLDPNAPEVAGVRKRDIVEEARAALLTANGAAAFRAEHGLCPCELLDEGAECRLDEVAA